MPRPGKRPDDHIVDFFAEHQRDLATQRLRILVVRVDEYGAVRTVIPHSHRWPDGGLPHKRQLVAGFELLIRGCEPCRDFSVTFIALGFGSRLPIRLTTQILE